MKSEMEQFGRSDMALSWQHDGQLSMFLHGWQKPIYSAPFHLGR